MTKLIEQFEKHLDSDRKIQLTICIALSVFAIATFLAAMVFFVVGTWEAFSDMQTNANPLGKLVLSLGLLACSFISASVLMSVRRCLSGLILARTALNPFNHEKLQVYLNSANCADALARSASQLPGKIFNS